MQAPVFACSVKSHQVTQGFFGGFPGGSDGEESAEDPDSISGSGRSPGKGHGNPLQYSAWRIPWPEKPGGYSP